MQRPQPSRRRKPGRVTSDGNHSRGQAAQAISNAVVRVMREYTGRGPTQAQTTISDNAVLVTLRDTLLKAERSLVNDGHAEAVMTMRRRFQATMQEELIAAVTEHTGRTVHAFLSDSAVEPDIAVEVFILEPRTPKDNGA